MRVGKWTLREWVQGVPLGHPTHPMLVHFPTALYPGALVLGILARVRVDDGFGRAAAVMLGVGVGMSVLAAVTGLVDWAGMIEGSTKRRAATRHLLVQVLAVALAGAGLVVHIADYGIPSVAALALLGASTVAMGVGNFLGGILVYRLGMRVG